MSEEGKPKEVPKDGPPKKVQSAAEIQVLNFAKDFVAGGIAAAVSKVRSPGRREPFRW